MFPPSTAAVFVTRLKTGQRLSAGILSLALSPETHTYITYILCTYLGHHFTEIFVF